MRTCASIKTLASLKLDCEPALIRQIWAAPDVATIEQLSNLRLQQLYSRWESRGELRRRAIDHVGGFHGVEYLGVNKRTGAHVYYCNAGDTYTGTIIFQGGRLTVGTWGDLIECQTVREFQQL